MNELIMDDELVNDFEFAERLYDVGFRIGLVDSFDEKQLIWQDLI